jgi:hypothetical protein
MTRHPRSGPGRKWTIVELKSIGPSWRGDSLADGDGLVGTVILTQRVDARAVPFIFTRGNPADQPHEGVEIRIHRSQLFRRGLQRSNCPAMVRPLGRSRLAIDETGHVGALGEIGSAGPTGEKVRVAGGQAQGDLDGLAQAHQVRKLVLDCTSRFIIQHRHHRAPNQGGGSQLPPLSLYLQPMP